MESVDFTHRPGTLAYCSRDEVSAESYTMISPVIGH